MCRSLSLDGSPPSPAGGKEVTATQSPPTDPFRAQQRDRTGSPPKPMEERASAEEAPPAGFGNMNLRTPPTPQRERDVDQVDKDQQGNIHDTEFDTDPPFPVPPWEADDTFPSEDTAAAKEGHIDMDQGTPPEGSELVSDMTKRISNVVTWDRMMGLIAFSGRRHMTKHQYEFFRASMKAANSKVNLSCYVTASTSHWDDVVTHFLPHSEIRFLRHLPRQRAARSTVKTADGEAKDAGDCVRLVLPSEWAKLDVLSLPFYNDVYSCHDNTRPGMLSIENAPMVQHRASVTGATLTMWADYENAVCPCEEGDVLRFPCYSGRLSAENESVTSSWSRGTRNAQDGSAHETLFDGVLGYLWLVSPTECAPPPDIIQQHWCELTQLERALVNILRLRPSLPLKGAMGRSKGGRSAQSNTQRQETIREAVNDFELRLYPGDVCGIIRPDGNAVHDHACLFVASPVHHAKGGCAERLVWVRPHEPESNSSDRLPYVYVAFSTVIRSIPLWMKGCRSRPTFPNNPSPNKGVLPDGTRYVVYRIALYTDGFKPSKNNADTKSVDGCYILPLGRGFESRKSTSSCRILSLTPDGHSPCDFLALIHEDLILGASKGFPSFDPYGRPVQIFIDTVAMFGDYPALTKASDLRGHNALSFCTFCTFREHAGTASGSRLYSTAWHSRRLGAMRTDTQREMIRPELDDAYLQQLLGYSTRDRIDSDNLPMVRLANDLRKVGSVRNAEGKPVVPPGFDSVQSMAAAPDHLISGLIDNTFHVCFASLANNTERRTVQVRIVSDAITNGLRQEGNFLQWSGNTFVGVRRISMSARICMLLAAVQPFVQQYAMTGRSVFLLPEKLQRFVAAVYHIPSAQVEGITGGKALTDNGMLRARGEQQRAAKEFIRSAAAFHRQDQDLGKILNKPNFHRAIELCAHSIATYGHAKQCSEMVLEMAHRKFKKWLETNSHPNAHITGVERAIFADWQNRVATLSNILKHGSSPEKSCASRGLRRLFLGEEGVSLDNASRPGQHAISAFDDAVLSAVASPVQDEMEMAVQINDLEQRTFSWEMQKTLQPETVHEDETMRDGRKLLEAWYAIERPNNDVTIGWHDLALYMSTSRFGGRRRSYKHLTVGRGCAVSIVASESSVHGSIVRKESDEQEGVYAVFAVYGVLGVSTGDVWCVGRQLRRASTGYYASAGRPAVVEMGHRCRRVALFHVCSSKCEVHLATQTIKHEADVCSGGLFRLMGRADGYPPHLG